MAEALFFHYRKGKGRVLWGVLGHTGGSPGGQEGGRGSVTRRRRGDTAGALLFLKLPLSLN